MYTPVEYHSASVFFLASPIAGDTARALNARLDCKDHAELSGAINVAEHKIICIPASVLVCGEYAIVFFRCSDHLFKILGAKCNGLFGDNVLSGLHRGNGDLLVHIVRCCDGYKINALVCENLVKR